MTDRPLDLSHTAKALEEFDAVQDELDAILYRARTNAQVDKWKVRDAAEQEKLAVAFHKDTADRNTLANCRLVHPGTLREFVAKWKATQGDVK